MSEFDMAFPSDNPKYKGMSLRDWFAGQIAVKLSKPLLLPGMRSDGDTRALQLNQISCDAYAIADALIAKREKLE